MNRIEIIVPPQTPGQYFGSAILRLCRWQIIGRFSDEPKFITIGAPHTTNWDFVMMLLLKIAVGVDMHWIGKDSLFHAPFGRIMKWSGGIPVNRRSRNNFVDQIVDLFNRRERLVIAITPEGTRSKANYWRTGFYYMALGANAPIQLVGIDYPSRTIEIGPLLMPSGDIEKDFGVIRKFYAEKNGKYPQKQGEILIKPEDI